MTITQLQVMILYLLRFFTDGEYYVYREDGEPFLVNGFKTYTDDGVSNIYHQNATQLNLFNNKYHVACIFNYVLMKLDEEHGIYVYAHYETMDEYGRVSLNIKTDHSTISSLYYSNHCLAYIDILLKLHNVYIDLVQFDRR